MKKTIVRRAAIALLLLLFLFLCVTIFFSKALKSFAAPVDVIGMPTIIITMLPDPIATMPPSPTAQSEPSPTVEPSPTSQPQPTATPRPRPTPTPRPEPTDTPVPTATPLPTATPKPTTIPGPTRGVTPTAPVKPTAVVTQKVGPVSPVNTPELHLAPTATPVASTSQKIVSPEHKPAHNDPPLMPLVIGTLLTLCLGAAGFVGIRRVRTALLPAVDVKKQGHVPPMQQWQRVRTVQTPVVNQEPIPFQDTNTIAHAEADIAPLAISNEIVPGNNRTQTGPHRRLGPVRLRKMSPEGPPTPDLPQVQQGPPKDFEDMSFLDDPLLQDTLRHYRQKGQQND